MKCEAAKEKAMQRAENARDGAAAAFTACVEAGVAFSETIQCSVGHQLSAADLKAIQQTTRLRFRQISSAWVRVRQHQEAWLKLSQLRHRSARKASAAGNACAEAEQWLQTVEEEHREALAFEEQQRASRLLCEQALLEAQGGESAAEVEHAGQKCRRSECMAAVGSAKAKLRPAKVAEKEASAGRTALLHHYSKGDKGQIKVELDATANGAQEAFSALTALKAEEYDANQVEDAYNQCQAKKKQRIEATTESD